MLFACIYVPDFPVQAVVRAEPELRGCGVAVLEGAAPQERVISANDAAREAGIEPGMSRLQAEAAPGIAVRPRDRERESAARAALLECAGSFSPRVEDTATLTEYGGTPGELVTLDIAGLESLFGTPVQIAGALLEQATQCGLVINVGVAGNPEAAMHAARGFAGVTVIPTGKEAGKLGSLPVDVLAPRREILETLDRWGIRNLRALAALPELALSERLGQEGLRLRRLAGGGGARLLVPLQEQLEFEEKMDLEHPVELLEPLAFILGRLLDQLCARMAEHALAANELRLRLTLDGSFQRAELGLVAGAAGDVPDAVHERTLRLPLPIANPRTFLKLLQLDLQAHPPEAPVLKVAIAAQVAKPRHAQSGLFLPKSPEPERLELTLARIAGIVGEENVGAAELRDTHRPGAFRMQKFSVVEQGTARQKQSGASETAMALRICRPPLAARVWVRDGVPIRVHFRGMRGVVAAITGPWRTAGDWWTREKWTRDEWDVALAAEAKPAPGSRNDDEFAPPGMDPMDPKIALYRLARDVQNDQWFVAGSYD